MKSIGRYCLIVFIWTFIAVSVFNLLFSNKGRNTKKEIIVQASEQKTVDTMQVLQGCSVVADTQFGGVFTILGGNFKDSFSDSTSTIIEIQLQSNAKLNYIAEYSYNLQDASYTFIKLRCLTQD